METLLKLSGVVAFHFSRMCNCPIRAAYNLLDKYIHPVKEIVMVEAMDGVFGERRESP